MITFQLVKQERLLHVGQCKIYNVEVDLEGPANIVANMLERFKNNYCTVSTSADGSLIRRAMFLHNTKLVTSNKVQQT